MKLVFRTVLFHFVCIIIFAICYFSLEDQFQIKNQTKITLLDYILLSTTIQAGVGISDIYPISFYGKLLMISQQLIMIMTNVFILYIFNLYI